MGLRSFIKWMLGYKKKKEAVDKKGKMTLTDVHVNDNGEIECNVDYQEVTGTVNPFQTEIQKIEEKVKKLEEDVKENFPVVNSPKPKKKNNKKKGKLKMKLRSTND